MLKQDETTRLTWVAMSSLLSMMIQRVLACEQGVGPRSVGHQVESHGEASLPKTTTSFLPKFSLNQLDFIQVTTSIMHVVYLFHGFGCCAREGQFSCVSLVYVRMFIL